MLVDDVLQKVLTVSRKSERLVNLTIALLATKRYLTKSEIFRSIEGYEGSEDSKERMFERDKDDLRTIGIEIEVGGLDPLFNDEAGYKIKPENYKLDLGAISGTDIALLSLAAQAWNGAALGSAANSALVKLKSMGIASDLDSIPTLAPRMAWSTQELESVLEAIGLRRKIVFTYLSSELADESREVFPYAVATKDGYWYFSGLDCTKNEIRTFRFDRVSGSIDLSGKQDAYQIPEGFDLLESVDVETEHRIAVVDIRKNKALSLRKKASAITDLGEWERFEFEYSGTASLIDSILWHLDDVVVLEPAELRLKIIEILNELVLTHG